MSASSPRWVLTLALFVGLGLSCSPAPKEGGGIGGTGITSSVTSGPVTGFGSVFVSGNEYDTTQASFMVDGQAATESHLKIGMVVLVDGTVTENYGTSDPVVRVAHTIAYEDTVEGIVQSVAPDGLSLGVMGQSLLVNQATVIDPSIPGQDVRNLVPGVDLVEASGFISGDGVIVASFVERKVGSPDYEVKGLVKNHDVGDKTFEVGALAVDYRTAEIGHMPDPGSGSWNGLLVDLRGMPVGSGGSGSNGLRLTAIRVEPEGLGVEDRGEAEVKGFVTQVLTIGDFMIGNVHVRTDVATVFERGTVEDIAVGVKLEAEGPLSAGVLAAEKVEFEESAKVQSQVATVEQRSESDGALTLVAFPGVTVQVDGHTTFTGDGRPRRLNDLDPGDHVKVRGRPAGSLTLVATEIERKPATSEIELQGPVTSAGNPTLVILGISVETSSIPDNKFKGPDEAIIGRTAFFGLLSPGKVVKIKGVFDNGALTWKGADVEGES